METMEIVWMVLLVGFAVIELATPQLVSIWFAAASGVALVLAFLNVDLWIQVTVFVVLSVVLLIATRPIYKKHLAPKSVATNAQALIGKNAVVTSEINNLHESGTVKIQGMTWTARADSDTVIPVDSVVTVMSISGVKLIVSPAE